MKRKREKAHHLIVPLLLVLCVIVSGFSPTLSFASEGAPLGPKYVAAALTRDDVTVSGLLPEGAALEVSDMPPEVIVKYVERGYQALFAYDISLSQCGEIPVAVTVELPERIHAPVEVLHIADNDIVTFVDGVTIAGGAVTFTTESFSGFIGLVKRQSAIPGDIYWNGSGFYSDESCATPLLDGNNDHYTNFLVLLDDLSGETTIHMKAGVTFSTQETINCENYEVTLKRHSSYKNALITVSSSGNLTLANITLDGGAVWTGNTVDPLGRGTTNSVSTAQYALIDNSGTLTISTGAILQNNDNTYSTFGRGGAVTNDGILNISGGTITNNKSAAGGAVRNQSGQIIMTGGVITKNHGNSAGGAFSLSSGLLNISGGSITYNLASGTSAEYGGGATSGYVPITISGDAVISGNISLHRGNGLNLYNGANLIANLYLSGTPVINDEVFIGSADNVITITDSFAPLSKIPLVLAAWTGEDRVVATYEEGLDPDPEHFAVLATMNLEIQGQNLVLVRPKDPSAIIRYYVVDLTVGTQLTAELLNAVNPTSYQWQRLDGANWTTIGTASTYVPSVADAGKQIHVIISYANGSPLTSPSVTILAPTFTVTIPETITASDANPSGDFDVTCSPITNLGTARLRVTLASNNYGNNTHNLKLGESANAPKLAYTLRTAPNGTPIGNNAEVATFTGSGGNGTLYYSIASPIYSGEYTDTLTFTVALIDP